MKRGNEQLEGNTASRGRGGDKTFKVPYWPRMYPGSKPAGPTNPSAKMNTLEISLTNPPEKISDDDTSDLILLKDLKPLVTEILENRQDKSAQELTNFKQEMPRKNEGAKGLSYAD